MEELKQRNFRANMCFLHIMYRTILRGATKKNGKVTLESWGDDAFYWMIGTNASDLSKYKNGKLVKATRVMRARTQQCKPLYNALLGEKLLYGSATDWEKYYIKGNRDELQERIEILLANIDKKVESDKDLCDVVKWICDKLAQYINEINGSSTYIVERAYESVGKFNFHNYDACNLDVLKKVNAILTEQRKIVDAVLKYKQYKEGGVKKERLKK